MPFKNTHKDYGSIAKWLHWGTALLFLAAYCAVYYRQWFTEKQTPENWTALQLHLSVGISIGVLVLLRIIWRLGNTPPRTCPGPAWQVRAAHLGHLLLYLMMVVMVFTGYTGTGANTEFFFLAEIPRFSDTAMMGPLMTLLGTNYESYENVADYIHKDLGGALLVWMLILGHALAAFYHHFVARDRTLKKML
ncbi:cytochrome b [Bowmanella dokdonensis]|uniref:Cytochrome b n=1 Tax=Bowmanella dokdonensis TaxID=751969 RepID=A0A939DP75_9ALTE|nr:cytochrome b [Bowmanella dokdonensis]MBN7825730.1 cytochrome b [Bowmanella dokdonensis]